MRPATTGPGASCPCPSRRAVLRTAVLGGSVAAAGLLAGCGSSDSVASGGGSSSNTPSQRASSPGSPTGSGNPPAAAGNTLGPVSDVPVGGGTIFAEAQVVVTQPTEGDFLAFSSTCTHAGCQVSEVIDGEIVCPCHGSHFSIEDGSPVAGPATNPLPSQQVSVDGDQLVLG
jgi:Rieske Fe-S protein